MGMKKYAMICHPIYDNFGNQINISKSLFKYEELGEKEPIFGFCCLINFQLLKTTREIDMEPINSALIDLDNASLSNDFIFEAEDDESAILIYEVS